MTFKQFPDSVEFYQKAKQIYLKNLFYLIDKIEKENKYKVEVEHYKKIEDYNEINGHNKENEQESLYYNSHLKHLKKVPIYFTKEPTYYEILTNLQISCELFLKKIIFDVSPYALVDLKTYKKDSTPIDFSKTTTADAQYLYSASVFFVGENYFHTKYNNTFESIYNNNKIERNSYLHRDSNNLTDGLSLLKMFIIVNDIFIKINLKKTIYKKFLKDIPMDDYKNRHNNNKRCSFLSIARYDTDIGYAHKVFYEEARFKFLTSMSYIYDALDENERGLFFNYISANKIDIMDHYFCPNCTMHSNIYLNSSNSTDYTNTIFEESKNNKYLKSLINIDKKNNKFKCFCCNDTYKIEKKYKVVDFNIDLIKLYVYYTDKNTCMDCMTWKYDRSSINYKHINFKIKPDEIHYAPIIHDICLQCGNENVSSKAENFDEWINNDESLFLTRKRYRNNRILLNKLQKK